MDINDILDMIDDHNDSSSDEGSDDDDTETFANLLRRNKKSKPLPTLQYLSLKSIADNIWYWMSHVPSNANDALYIISPFDVLRSSETMSIIRLLSHNKTFRHEHFHLFLHYKLTSMDFSILSKHATVTDNAMKCMFKRCKHLKDLTIPDI